ncbi:hypothetical protein NFJ02_24g55080 [Pycnococcus provasolii]
MVKLFRTPHATSKELKRLARNKRHEFKSSKKSSSSSSGFPSQSRGDTGRRGRRGRDGGGDDDNSQMRLNDLNETGDLRPNKKRAGSSFDSRRSHSRRETLNEREDAASLPAGNRNGTTQMPSRPFSRQLETNGKPSRKYDKKTERLPKRQGLGLGRGSSRNAIPDYLVALVEKRDANTIPDNYVATVQDKLLQPRPKHYGGMGLAKESQFVRLDDPQFAETFATLFAEHVQGCSGGRVKRTHSKNARTADLPLWRQRLRASEQAREKISRDVAAAVVETKPTSAPSAANILMASKKAEAKELEATRELMVARYRAIRASKGRPSMTL